MAWRNPPESSDSVSPHLPIVWCVTIGGLSIATGWWIPAFDDWTGTDQSRRQLIVACIAMRLLIVQLATWVFSGWLQCTERWRSYPRRLPPWFSIGQVLAGTALVVVGRQSAMHGFVAVAVNGAES
jgi:hypothetical protein